MLIEEIIQEIRAEPYPYTVEEKTHGELSQLSASFTTRDQSTITVRLTSRGIESLSIMFDRNGEFKISSTGDQFKILFTVLKIIEEHLPEVSESVNTVLFTADNDEPSRVRLYQNRLVPVISRILGSGWTKQPPNVSPFGSHYFVWNRNEPITENPNAN